MFLDASDCFTDSMPMKAGKAGDWTVKHGNKSCARYSFSAVINVTYPTLLGKVNLSIQNYIYRG